MPDDFKYAVDVLAAILWNKKFAVRNLLAEKLGQDFTPYYYAFRTYEFSPEDRTKLKNIGGVLIGVGLALMGSPVKIQSNEEIAEELRREVGK